MKKFFFLVFLPAAFTTTAQVGIGTTTPKSTLDINGSVSNKVTVISTSATLDIDNAVVLCNNTAAITVYLPSAATIAGRLYHVKSINNAPVLVSPVGGQTIDGAASYTLSSQYDELEMISDGSNWYVLNKNNNGSSNNSALHHIGEEYGGGIIFYLDESGSHGLIAAASDQSTGIKWNNAGTESAGEYFYAQLQGLFSGEANTYFLISFNAGTYAASICYNLVLNGFTDWYLPSVEELTLMYRNLYLQGLGNFSGTAVYWSSTAFQNNNEGAYVKWFSTGDLALSDISDLNSVRAVRAF